MTELILPVGRLVVGHPMKRNAVMDDRTTPPTPVMQADGVTPATDAYIAVAVVKGAEPHWNQTAWGRVIYNEGVVGWPAGEHGSPTFAWKITDGDSTIPNQKGKKPCEREGYPGHWIIHCKTRWSVKSYHKDRYSPEQEIQDTKEIKPGDYCCVVLDVKGNAPSQSPGVYINPTLFSLERAGIAISLGDGPDAAAAFGGAARELPANAQIDTAVVAPPAVPAAAAPPVPPAAGVPAPHTGFLNNAPPVPGAPPAPAPPAPPAPAVENYNVNGQVYTRAALEAAGYKPEQIAALPKA